MIEDVVLTTENCRYCLMCRHVCPVAHVTRKETLSPHGWGLTIASISRGLLEFDADTIDVIYSCADCGTCRANCITDQPLPAAIAATRTLIVEQGLAPKAAVEVHKKLKKWSNPYIEQRPKEVQGKGDVALFVGDDAQHLAPGVLEAALKLLAAVDVKPVLIGIGRNNGYLASSLGYKATAADLAQTTLNELQATGAQTMLVLAPGDYFAFASMHRDRLGIDFPEHVELTEVIPFLAECVEYGRLWFKKAAESPPHAYVDPTHAIRVPGRFDAPRKLLSQVMESEGCELFWYRDRAHPVGNVALQYTQPHIASHLTYSRLGSALEKGVRLIITEDPGTLVHLRRHADRFGVKVQGLYELLAAHVV